MGRPESHEMDKYDRKHTTHEGCVLSPRVFWSMTSEVLHDSLTQTHTGTDKQTNLRSCPRGEVAPSLSRWAGTTPCSGSPTGTPKPDLRTFGSFDLRHNCDTKVGRYCGPFSQLQDPTRGISSPSTNIYVTYYVSGTKPSPHLARGGDTRVNKANHFSLRNEPSLRASMWQLNNS